MSIKKRYYGKELYHHGIKGMKWGIRRYQNEDGSLTEEGKKRYLSSGLKKHFDSDGDLTVQGGMDYVDRIASEKKIVSDLTKGKVKVPKEFAPTSDEIKDLLNETKRIKGISKDDAYMLAVMTASIEKMPKEYQKCIRSVAEVLEEMTDIDTSDPNQIILSTFMAWGLFCGIGTEKGYFDNLDD